MPAVSAITLVNRRTVALECDLPEPLLGKADDPDRTARRTADCEPLAPATRLIYQP